VLRIVILAQTKLPLEPYFAQAQALN